MIAAAAARENARRWSARILNEAEAQHLLSRRRFLPFINSSFTVRSESGARAWLRLLAVEDLSVKPPEYTAPSAVLPKVNSVSLLRSETFGLRFSGAGDALSQDTYEFDHASLGSFALFLVPSGESQYLAVINRSQ